MRWCKEKYVHVTLFGLASRWPCIVFGGTKAHRMKKQRGGRWNELVGHVCSATSSPKHEVVLAHLQRTKKGLKVQHDDTISNNNGDAPKYRMIKLASKDSYVTSI
jgi:hypothetical protein